MKKNALLLLLAAMFSMPVFAGDGPQPIKLISYNLRNSGAKDGDNSWSKRRPATPQMIRQEAPDVFGVQEGLIDQLQYIDTECPQYARVGEGRDDGAEGGEITTSATASNWWTAVRCGSARRPRRSRAAGTAPATAP